MHNKFFKKILQAIQTIKCDLIQSNAFYCVAVECAKAGQFDKSIELSEMIKSEYYRIQLSIDMAEIYRETGLENKARERLSFATHLTQSSSTLHPHYYANFSSRIAVQYFALGDEKNIFESLEKSSYPSVKRNQTVANILLAELSKMPPNSNQRLLKAKHYAQEIFREINNNSELFTILLAELTCKQAKKGFFEKALKTLDYLKKSKAGSEKVGKALICLAEQYAQLGNFEVALTMYEEIEDLHMKNLMLSKIAEAYAQFRQFEAAIQISSCISCSEIRDMTFSDIAEVCATKAELTDLCQVLEQLNSYKIRELSRLKSFVLSTFVSKLAKNQQYVKGIELANKIKSRTYKIEALQSLTESLNMFAKNLQSKSEVDSIYHDLEAILKSANRQKKLLSANLIKVKVANTYAVVGKTNKARQLLVLILAHINKFDTIDSNECLKARLLGEIAIVYNLLGDFKNSELILTKSLALVSSHRVWIAQLFTKAGLYDRSLQILDKLDLNFISLLDTKIFLELAKRLREDGQEQKFFDVLQKAIEFVQLLKESEQPQGFGQIIQTYLSLGFGL